MKAAHYLFACLFLPLSALAQDTALQPEEIKALLAGEGMGLAKPAENNAYPGPRHVLERQHALNLTPEQLQATQRLFNRMRSGAQRLGEQIVSREAELFQLFKSRQAAETRIMELTAEIGRLQGELRALHLTTHLEQTALLSPEQIKGYYAAAQHGNHAPAEGKH